MFYQLDSTRVTLREYWWGTPNPLVVFGWLTKWLRIRLPGSVDDPNVESLEPFRVAREELPEAVRVRFRPVEEEFDALGFESPVYYWVRDAVHQTDLYQAVYRHEGAQALGRIHYRVWNITRPPKEYFFASFLTRYRDATYLVSTAGKRDMLAPPSCRENRKAGAPAGALWELHQQALRDDWRAATVDPVRDDYELVEAVEAHHAAVRDFHVERGVFVPMKPEREQAALEAARSARPASRPRHDEASGEPLELVELAEAEPAHNAAVLAEIERLQNKRPGWVGALVILGVSLALFVGLGAARWSWELVLLLLPVLFLHELGHYAAMRAFHYRNVRMFFIPLFGAAVSGQHYNVPGWKKTIVSLMGPLPGIFLAAGLGIVGLIVERQWLVNAALLTLILNGFNLLPILPLDGGWVMHSLFFSRHYLLDVGFRFLAAVGLMLLSIPIETKIFFYLGLFMLFGLPMTYRQARLVQRLRKRGLPAASPDSRTIPPATANVIIDALRGSYSQALTNKTLAQMTVQAFEALNARPPGWLATIGLAGVHLASFVFALVFVGVLFIGQHGGFRDFLGAAMRAPKNPIDAESIEVRRGPEATQNPDAEKTIVATFDDPAEARAAFGRMAGNTPPRATWMRFGQSLLLTIPAEDDQTRERWFAEFERQTGDVHVSSPLEPSMIALMAIAPHEEAALQIERELRAYLDADPAMHLVPPWHPNLRIAPAEQAARATYLKLTEPGTLYDDPEIAELERQIGEAHRRGDSPRAGALRGQVQEHWKRAEEARLDELRREARDPAETAVIDLFRQQPRFDFDPEADDETARQQAAEQYQRRRAEWAGRMGRLLGQLPLEGDDVRPGEDRFSGAGGVVRTGLILQVDLIGRRLVDGPPAIVRWLADRGCADMKYAIAMGY